MPTLNTDKTASIAAGDRGFQIVGNAQETIRHIGINLPLYLTGCDFAYLAAVVGEAAKSCKPDLKLSLFRLLSRRAGPAFRNEPANG